MALFFFSLKKIDALSISTIKPSSLLTNGRNTPVVSNTIIPEEYSLFSQRNIQGVSKLLNIGNTKTADASQMNRSWQDEDRYLAFRSSEIIKGKTAVKITNVGYDKNGQLLDMILTILDFQEGNINHSDILFTGLRIGQEEIQDNALASIDFRVDYVIHGTDQATFLPGTFILGDLDKNESIKIYKETIQQVAHVYVPVKAGKNGVYEYGESDTNAYIGTVQSDNDALGAVQFALNNRSSFHFQYKQKDKKIWEIFPNDSPSNLETWEKNNGVSILTFPAIRYGKPEMPAPSLTVTDADEIKGQENTLKTIEETYIY